MKGDMLRVTDDEIMRFQQQKVIEAGRLREWCTEHYGEKLTEKTFCSDCDYRELCAAEKSRKVGKIDTKKPI